MNRLSSSELSFAFLIACSVKANILLMFRMDCCERCASPLRCIPASGVGGGDSRFAYTTFGTLLVLHGTRPRSNCAGFWSSAHKVVLPTVLRH